jgi:fatty acid/phospholipid biosynthesis enzyme
MRQLLSIVVFAALVSVVADVMISPGKTAAHMEVAKGQFQNGVSVYGLHIALPDTMKTFPAELVPLP